MIFLGPLFRVVPRSVLDSLASVPFPGRGFLVYLTLFDSVWCSWDFFCERFLVVPFAVFDGVGVRLFVALF